MRDTGKETQAKALGSAEQRGVTTRSALAEAIALTVADVILRQAKERRADLIVLGTVDAVAWRDGLWVAMPKPRFARPRYPCCWFARGERAEGRREACALKRTFAEGPSRGPGRRFFPGARSNDERGIHGDT